MIADPILIAAKVAEAFDSCGIRYVIGGSLSSSLSGEPRSTLDIDMVAELNEGDSPAFVTALEMRST